MESLFLLVVRENVEIATHEIVISIVDRLPIISLNASVGQLHVCEGVSKHFWKIVEVDGVILEVIKLIEDDFFSTVWEFDVFDHVGNI